MTHLVFVYGTLKRGHGNNLLIAEGGGEFIGEAVTEDRFMLVGEGIPFAYPKTSGLGALFPDRFYRPIRGEVFRVDDSTLARLDMLEGHPHSYFRTETLVRIKESTVHAFIYSYPRGYADPDHACPVVDGCYEWSR